MSHSNTAIQLVSDNREPFDNRVIPRNCALRFAFDVSQADIERKIDDWNDAIFEVIRGGPEVLFFQKEPKLEMSEEGTVLAYYMYANTVGWEQWIDIRAGINRLVDRADRFQSIVARPVSEASYA